MATTTKPGKEPKHKPAYSVVQNTRYTLRQVWRWDKWIVFMSALRIPLIVIAPMLTIYLSSTVVRLVTDGTAPGALLSAIGSIAGIILLLMVCDKTLDSKIATKKLIQRFRFIELTAIKNMDTDYQNVEGQEGQTKLGKTYMSASNNGSATEDYLPSLVRLLSSVLGLTTYAAVIWSLDVWIVLVVALASVGSYLLTNRFNRWVFTHRHRWEPMERKLLYLWSKSKDFSEAKDIRLFHMQDWFSAVFSKAMGERMVWHRKQGNQSFLTNQLTGLLFFLRDGFAYGYLVFLLFHQGLPVERFILYFGLIGGLSSWVTGLVNELNTLNQHSLSMCDLRAYLEMPDRFNRGPGLPVPQDTCSIEFRDVSFGYEADKPIIQHINFTIQKGEKIAIVGKNGAGKTTLIKLLCGFYMPVSGEILLDGQPLTAYNRDDIYHMIGAVFQDMNMLPVTLRQNISCQYTNNTDDAQLHEAVKIAGLEAKMATLPKGLDTQMGKSMFDDATDLSGGETQKLALARALYKTSKLLVLDEPTAALDPIAESAMYAQYNQMSAGKTSIFISHRLASTRFCDRILFVDNGTIAEQGTHDKLLAQGGLYSEMYHIQSKYYQENMDMEGAL